MAEFVVEALEVVDVEQADREPAARLHPQHLGLERLQQAAPVGDLRQLVGRYLVRQAPQLALEVVDRLRQFGRAVVLGLQPLARLRHRSVHAAALVDEFAHHARQALQRIGLLDHIGIARGAALEAAGLHAELAQPGEHARHHRLQRQPGPVALEPQRRLVGAGLGQQFADRTQPARGQALFEEQPHRVALAARPRVVLGQLGQARRQLRAQRAELVEQALPMLQHGVGLLAQRIDCGHLLRAGPGLAQAPGGCRECIGKARALGVARRQRGGHAGGKAGQAGDPVGARRRRLGRHRGEHRRRVGAAVRSR